jgi:hypothetical protein
MIMQPETKNDCAANSQQQFAWPDQDGKKQITALFRVVIADRLLSSERRPHSRTHINRLGKNKNILMGPDGA